MFKKVDWPVAEDFKGERELEVAWVRRQLKGAENKTVADFGCINYGNYDGEPRWVGVEKYGLASNNRLLGFDRANFADLRERYTVADLLVPGFCKSSSIDIGVSVSVIEHVGINCEPRIANGDFIALCNMYDTIRPGGRLLITVPVSRVFYEAANWIRVYTPQVLRSHVANLSGSYAEYEYYRFVPPGWMVATDDDGLEEMARIPIDQSKRKGVACLACLTIHKTA